MSINTPENKGMLWSLLDENNIFHGIPDNKFNTIKTVFENTIINIDKIENKSLIEKNKMAIQELNKNISREKNNTPKIKVVYKAEDIKNTKQNELNVRFENSQKEMNNLLNPTIPDSPDFSDDKNDKPIGGEMDRLISEMMASRERELEIPNYDQNEAEKWINNGNVKKDNYTIPDNLNDEPSNVIINDNKEKKQVSFKIEETNNDSSNIFSKLKKIPILEQSNEFNLEQRINDLEKNQLHMLELLNKIATQFDVNKI